MIPAKTRLPCPVTNVFQTRGMSIGHFHLTAPSGSNTASVRFLSFETVKTVPPPAKPRIDHSDGSGIGLRRPVKLCSRSTFPDPASRTTQ